MCKKCRNGSFSTRGMLVQPQLSVSDKPHRWPGLAIFLSHGSNIAAHCHVLLHHGDAQPARSYCFAILFSPHNLLLKALTALMGMSFPIHLAPCRYTPVLLPCCLFPLGRLPEIPFFSPSCAVCAGGAAALPDSCHPPQAL